MTSRSIISAGIIAALSSGTAFASTMTYQLEDSNVLPDGTPYLNVNIAENADMEGTFDFTVTPTENLVPGNNFGIQAFGLNVDAVTEVEEGDDGFALTSDPLVFSNITDGFTIDTDTNMSEFGRFDVRLSSTGHARTDELQFTVSGTSADLLGDSFAAHVAGIDGDVESGFFGGGTLVEGGDGVQPPQAVPVPPAALLFGSGLIGMTAVSRRKKNA